MTILSLSNQEIGDADLEHHLSNLNLYTGVNLSNNFLTNNSLVQIMQKFKEYPNIEYIDLTNNPQIAANLILINRRRKADMSLREKLINDGYIYGYLFGGPWVAGGMLLGTAAALFAISTAALPIAATIGLCIATVLAGSILALIGCAIIAQVGGAIGLYLDLQPKPYISRLTFSPTSVQNMGATIGAGLGAIFFTGAALLGSAVALIAIMTAGLPMLATIGLFAATLIVGSCIVLSMNSAGIGFGGLIGGILGAAVKKLFCCMPGEMEQNDDSAKRRLVR